MDYLGFKRKNKNEPISEPHLFVFQYYFILYRMFLMVFFLIFLISSIVVHKIQIIYYIHIQSVSGDRDIRI